MTVSTAPSAPPADVPSVLVVLAVRDAAGWLRACLQGLASQTHPKLGVLAIDIASTDGSSKILASSLGEARVLRLPARVGFAEAYAAGAAHPAAARADHLLLLHDDAVLDPEAIARMVEATQIEGIDRVGLVGGKIVAEDDHRRLLDVGRSADRFGHPYSPLQAGEIDQGQFDRVLEVLSVDGCATLVTRETWRTLGLFDERLGDHADLDLGWRVRVAGSRVLMTPLARVRHRAVGEDDDRPDATRSHRHGEDRAALATISKNYSLVTLLWVLPLFVLLSAIRLLYLGLSRRLDEASELLSAFGWNVAHLPGTWSRRRAVQKQRRVRDHALRRFTESAGLRLPRWFATAERIWEEQHAAAEDEEGQPAGRRLRHRTASMFSAHPVIVVSFLAVVVGAFAVRHLVGVPELAGGAIPAFPPDANAFFAELVSGFRTTGLGGTDAASPALGAMGGLSFLLFGSTALAQKVMLLAGPAVATIACYRACARWTGSSGPAALAAAAYGLSAVVLWAFSDGRLALLVALAVIPTLLERTARGFAPTPPTEGATRFVVGLAVILAIGVAFVPGTVTAFALVVLVCLIGGPRRAGVVWVLMAAIGACVLLFPFIPSIVAGGGAAMTSFVGEADPWRLLRFGLGDAPGDWVPAAYLTLAAVVGLGLASAERRGDAARMAAVLVLALSLAWAGAAGYLPGWATNPEVFVGLAAAAAAVLVAIGLRSIAGGVAHESFGGRQVGAALITVALGVGFVAQSLAAMSGSWAVGGVDRATPAWAVVDSTATGAFRVLWIGGPDGRSFPAPGGDPVAEVRAGGQVLRYQLTDRDGTLVVDTGRSLAGPGGDALEAVAAEIIRGGSVHGGAMLAPFAIGFVVADPALPPATAAAFSSQVDLDRVASAGLAIWRNAVVIRTAAAVTPTDEQRAIIGAPDLAATQAMTSLTGEPLLPVDGGWEGPAAGATEAVVATTYDAAWSLDGSDADPSRAFGWSLVMPTEGQSSARVRFDGQLPATVSAWLLAVVWIVALWVTRKPVPR